MISYRFVPISSQKGVLFLRHPADTMFIDIGVLRVEILILKTELCIHLKTKALACWPKHVLKARRN